MILIYPERFWLCSGDDLFEVAYENNVIRGINRLDIRYRCTWRQDTLRRDEIQAGRYQVDVFEGKSCVSQLVGHVVVPRIR